MAFRQVFDIIGPIMIGPSSSHTAGAARIGRVARQLFGTQPKKAEITLYGSFAQTYRGHGTDIALVGGLLDFDTFDDRMRDSLQIAKTLGIEIRITPSTDKAPHPNTAKIQLFGDGPSLEIIGISIGGGAIEIVSLNQFRVSMSVPSPTLVVLHQDKKGMIAGVTAKLSQDGYNIGHMEVSRKSKGSQALMVIEVDEPVQAATLERVRAIPEVLDVSYIHV
jgi:L-serine dehydratase